ncbi:hypothetical protein [Streptosporangium sp. NPDC000396]|uniref:hypothetical protein n=1 Tax=Streptosporangium sp. NPDC000396 TaxID=3366185 RepID=UPI0036BFC058
MIAVRTQAEIHLAEIYFRYGPGHLVNRSIIKAAPYIIATLYTAQAVLKART